MQYLIRSIQFKSLFKGLEWVIQTTNLFISFLNSELKPLRMGRQSE